MAKLVDLGGAPVNQSEREIIELLIRDLPKAWSVIPNATIPDQRTGHAYEYDAIVIGSYAVYVVEVKGWRGTIRQLGQADWQLGNGRIERNPLPLADLKAKVLATHLKNASLPGRRRPFVQACLVCGSDDATFDIYGPDASRCLRPADAVPYLRDARNLPFSNPENFIQIHDQLVRSIVGTLEPRIKVDRRYGSYRATTLQRRDDERAIWLGRHALLDEESVVQIRAWYLSSYRYTEEERQLERARLKRAAEALAKVGAHPRVARLRDFGEQDGEFFEVTDWSENGTLATAFVRGALARLEPRAQLQIIRDIAEALEAARQQGVYHRALSPENVLLDANGRAKLTGFELAFVEGAAGGTVYGLAAHPHAEFLPPELRDMGDYDVFDNSDLYSLAKMCGVLFPNGLPHEYQQVLERCLADDPAQRPSNPAELLGQWDAAQGEVVAKQTSRDEAGDEGAKVSLREFEVGDVVDGVNTIVAVLGRGAGSVVYRVSNEPLGCDLALKLMVSPPDGYDPGAEFRLLKAVNSPRVPRPHWLGRLKRGTADTQSYLLLDLVEGKRLNEVLKDGPLEPERALGLADNMLEALEALHAAGTNGVLHRDVKPANIVVGPSGATLLDFGTARDATDAGSAPEGTLRVTPPDLAATGWEPQADVFAAACVIYEMLSGSPPWSSAPTPDVLPPPLDGVPPALAKVIRKALGASAAERFPDAASLRKALVAACMPAEQVTVSSERRPKPSKTSTTLGSLVATAGEQIWTPNFITSLTGHPDLIVPLVEALAGCNVRAGDEALGARDFLLGSEARAAALEAPLAEAMPQAYDVLLKAQVPCALGGPPQEESSASKIKAGDSDIVLLLDAMHFTDWQTLEQTALVLDATLRRWAWAAPVEPETEAVLSTVFHVPPRHRALTLARGDRAALELGQLVEERKNELESTILDALGGATPGTAVWIVGMRGLVHLGHGLRRDVGEGLGEHADAARAAWGAAFGKQRRTGASAGLACRLREPLRELDGWRYPIARLGWPDPPGTPWLQSGGLSLPERAQMLFRFTRETQRG